MEGVSQLTVGKPFLELLEGRRKIGLVLQHPPRDPMNLVGQEVDGVVTFDQGGVGAAGDKALDGHLDWLRVPPISLLLPNILHRLLPDHFPLSQT